ncbi:MAG TPA: hypothetical protein VK906_01010 [Egicoccus sp.]|nr:hypothetical protein [Egicoccus sp.]HSK21718.1 hypothetical protein [Egicoccus sp.]
MGIVLLLIILALVFGGIGLLVEGLFWLLVIGAVLLVAGAVMGFTKSRSGRGSAAG